jgi:hypothetical protein
MINELPQPVQCYFNEVKSNIHGKSETRANQIAWAITKSKFNKVENMFVAKASDFETIKKVHYEFVADTLSVSKAEDDDNASYIDYILSDNNLDKHNTAYEDFALKSMVAQINEEGLVGRIDDEDFETHPLYKQLVREGKSSKEVKEYLQSLDTGIKAISAKYDNGRMIAKLKVKNELVSKVLSYKGASIETVTPSSSFINNKYKQAHALGFVFTNNPVNPNTGIAL